MRSRQGEAERTYAEALAASDKALWYAPNQAIAHLNKGAAFTALGHLFADLSRQDEAEGAFVEAVAAYDEALLSAPDYIDAHVSKATGLMQWGEYMASLAQSEVARSKWELAHAHVGRALALAPQNEEILGLLADIREQLDSLDTELSQEG